MDSSICSTEYIPADEAVTSIYNAEHVTPFFGRKRFGVRLRQSGSDPLPLWERARLAMAIEVNRRYLCRQDCLHHRKAAKELPHSQDLAELWRQRPAVDCFVFRHQLGQVLRILGGL